MSFAQSIVDANGRACVPLVAIKVMGILNVTPDSFSDGGRFFSLEAARERALRMLDDGADIIDIGGESTRPGAAAVSVDEELDRVMPVIESLTAAGDVTISIDTSKPQVMRCAAAAGVGFINDIRALDAPDAISAAAESGLPVCLMHRRGEPRDMQNAPAYDDVVSEVADYLVARVAACIAGGIAAHNIVVDPGFGFGKSPAHNLALVNAISRFALIAPVMLGVSRKSTLGVITGRSVEQRLAASLTLAVVAARSGVSILRVHDVAETVDALRVLAALEEESISE